MSDDGDSCNEPHQESYREKLASLSTELEQTESRLAAIQYLSEMIKKNTSCLTRETLIFMNAQTACMQISL